MSKALARNTVQCSTGSKYKFVDTNKVLSCKMHNRITPFHTRACRHAQDVRYVYTHIVVSLYYQEIASEHGTLAVGVRCLCLHTISCCALAPEDCI